MVQTKIGGESRERDRERACDDPHPLDADRSSLHFSTEYTGQRADRLASHAARPIDWSTAFAAVHRGVGPDDDLRPRTELLVDGASTRYSGPGPLRFLTARACWRGGDIPADVARDAIHYACRPPAHHSPVGHCQSRTCNVRRRFAQPAGCAHNAVLPAFWMIETGRRPVRYRGCDPVAQLLCRLGGPRSLTRAAP